MKEEEADEMEIVLTVPISVEAAEVETEDERGMVVRVHEEPFVRFILATIPAEEQDAEIRFAFIVFVPSAKCSIVVVPEAILTEELEEQEYWLEEEYALLRTVVPSMVMTAPIFTVEKYVLPQST